MGFSHSSSDRLCPIFNRRILNAARAAHPVRLNQIEQIRPKSKSEKLQVIVGRALRYLVGDDSEKCARVTALMKRVEDGLQEIEAPLIFIFRQDLQDNKDYKKSCLSCYPVKIL